MTLHSTWSYNPPPIPVEFPSSHEAIESRERVQRCVVLKKPGNDPRAVAVASFLRELGVQHPVVRTGVRYDVQGLSDVEFHNAIPTVFSEAPVNDVYDQDAFLAETNGKTVIPIEALPGQYDQAADSAGQCLELVTRTRPEVRMAQIIVIDGEIGDVALRQLETYLINKTDSRVAEIGVPESLHEDFDTPENVVEIIEGFRSFGEARLTELVKDFQLALSMPDLRNVQEYFSIKGRDPTITELKVIHTYWSDHCRHTTFTTEIQNVSLEGVSLVKSGQVTANANTTALSSEGRAVASAVAEYMADRDSLYGNVEEKPLLSLMDLALFSMKEARKAGLLADLEQSEENNAASIIVPVHFEDGHEEEWLFMFKNETHNHPTELEPFGGAATCLGGAIRDPLSGRAYVFGGMRITGSADPRQPIGETMSGKLPQRRITTGAADGFSGYGNQIGVPTNMVHEMYHPGYVAKRLETGFVVGAVRRDQVVRERPEPGDVIILLGGKTGRDGNNGAGGSSVVHTETSVATRGAEVQKGNPLPERAIQRLFRKSSVSSRIKRCNDFGAGGICVAIGEIAEGVDVDLAKVPLKYKGMEVKDIATSESQERMAVAVRAQDADAFIAEADAENLEATVVGYVQEEQVFRMQSGGSVVCELDRAFLSGGWAKRTANVSLRDPGVSVRQYLLGEPGSFQSLEECWRANLGRLNVCSQRSLQWQFDSTVGANSVTSPYGGMYQSSPAEASVVRFPVEGAKTRVAFSASADADLASRSPFHGGYYAVIDAVARLVASGASPEEVKLTLQNYFGKLTDENRWGQPFLAQLGARKAQKALGAPPIGGKDSMSGTFINEQTAERYDVPPTLLTFAVKVLQEERVIPSHFEQPGNMIVHLPVRLGSDHLPDVGALKTMWAKVHEMQQKGSILSCHAVRTGGIAAALTEMAVGNRIGLTINGKDQKLFTPQYGSMVVEMPEQDVHLLGDVPYAVLGKTVAEQEIRVTGAEGAKEMCVALADLQRAWEAPLSAVFPDQPSVQHSDLPIDPPIYAARPNRPKHRRQIARPRASILTFPGTNCEYESQAAFERAGAHARTELFINRTRRHIDESIRRYAGMIGESQILMIPGGFSAGDQPDGSAKFIANVLRNDRIKEAVEKFLDQDGLILGICNGFQALVKARLLSGGIGVQKATDVTLTHNDIGRFLSMNIMHHVQSVRSPWMQRFDVGELVDFPIAHGEGKLINLPASVWEEGLVPFCYCGRDGAVRMSFPDNPNGSEGAAASLTDETGRVFGMMAHPERALPGLGLNIETKRLGQKLFDAGVSYFA